MGNSETETEKQRMAVCGLSLHLGGSESRKTLKQKFIFQIGTLSPYGCGCEDMKHVKGLGNIKDV